MKTIRLLIKRGVTLPGGIDALPEETHEVEERFGKSLLFDGRAVPATDVLDPDQDEDPPEEEAPDQDDAPQAAPAAIQDRDPRPINRDPARRRQGPRR